MLRLFKNQSQNNQSEDQIRVVAEESTVMFTRKGETSETGEQNPKREAMFQTQAMNLIFNRTSMFDEDDHPNNSNNKRYTSNVTRRYVPRQSVANLGRHRPHHQAIRRRRYTRSLARNPIGSTTTTNEQNVRNIGNTANNRSFVGRLLRIYSRIADFNSSHSAANIVTSNTTATRPTTTTAASTTSTAPSTRATTGRAPTPIPTWRTPTSSFFSSRWSGTNQPCTSGTISTCNHPVCVLRNRQSTSSGFGAARCSGCNRCIRMNVPGSSAASGSRNKPQQEMAMRSRLSGPRPPWLQRDQEQHSYLHQIQHQRFVQHSNIEQRPTQRSVSQPPQRQQQQQPPVSQQQPESQQRQYRGNPNDNRNRSSSITRMFAGLFTRRSQRNVNVTEQSTATTASASGSGSAATSPQSPTFPHSFRCFCCGPFNCRICASSDVGPGGQAADDNGPPIELGRLDNRNNNPAIQVDSNIRNQLAIQNQPGGEQSNQQNSTTGGSGGHHQPSLMSAMQICCCNCCCGGVMCESPPVLFRFVRPRRLNNTNQSIIEPYMMDLPSASSLVSISQLESVSSSNLITHDNRHHQYRPSPILEEETWADASEIVADLSTTTLSSSTFETTTVATALPTPLITSEPINTVQARHRSSSLGAVPISRQQQQQLQLQQQQRSQQPLRTASSLSVQAVASFVSDNCISAQHHQTHTTSWLPPADVWDQITSVYHPVLNCAGPTTAPASISASASISAPISVSASISASVFAQSSSSSSSQPIASSHPPPTCFTSASSVSQQPSTTESAPGFTSQSAYRYPNPEDIPGSSHQNSEQPLPVPVPSTSHAGLVLLAPPTIPAEQSTSTSTSGSTNQSQPVAIALPYGWELACDSKGQTYYINHLNCTSTYCTPLDKASLNDPQPKPRMVTIKRDPQLGFGFVVGSDRPVIVRFVKESGPSETLLKPGDIIYQVNGQDITKSPRDHVINLIKSSTETVTLLVCQPVHDSRKKSSLMTEAKRTRLRQNPRRVRFAEGVIVNGSPMFSSTMADSICNCMSNSSGSSSSSSSSPSSAASQAHTHEEGSRCPLLDPDQQHVHCCPYAIADDHCCYGLSHMDFDSDFPDIPNVLKVFLENGQTKTFKYDGTTTVQNLVDLLCEKLTITNCFYFGLVIEQVHNGGRVTCPHPPHKQQHHHHHHHHHPIHHVHHQQNHQQQSNNNHHHHHHNHNHKVQNIVRFYGNNRLMILDPNDMIMNVVAKPNAHNLRCLFRLVTALPNPLRMLENDPHSFEYFYHQCCNDLSLERFVPEIKYETAVRLATFHIFEYILSHLPAQSISSSSSSSSSSNGWWKNITEMHKKSFLKWLDREFGLQNFVPQSLYCSMKRKELIRLISHSFKMDQQLFLSMNPTLFPLSTTTTPSSASPPTSSSSSASSSSSSVAAATAAALSGSYIISASAPVSSSPLKSSSAPAPRIASPSLSDTVPMTIIIRALDRLNQTIDSAAAMAMKAKLSLLQKLSELPCYGAKVFSTTRIVPWSGPGNVVVPGGGPSTPNRQSPTTTKAGSSSGGGLNSSEALGPNGKNAAQPEVDTSADDVAEETKDQKDTPKSVMKITVLNESLIVNAKHGLCYMICSNPQQPITVVRSEDIVQMNILKNDQTFLFDIEIVAQESIFNKIDALNPNQSNDLSKFFLSMDSDDTQQFVLMVKSYHSLLLSKSNLNVSRIPGHLPLINCNWKMMIDQALIIVKWDCPPDWWVDTAPRYYGIHRVVGAGWNYGVFGNDPINAIEYILQFADENNFIEFPDRQMLFYNNNEAPAPVPVPVPVPQQVPDQPEPEQIPEPVNDNYRQVDLSIPPPVYNEQLAVQAQREQREQLIALNPNITNNKNQDGCNPEQIRSITEMVPSIDSRDSQLYAIEEMNQKQRQQLSPIDHQSVDIPSAISMDILESHGIHGKLNQSPSMNNLMLMEPGPSNMVMMMDTPNNSNSGNYSQSNFDINQSDLSHQNSIVVQVDINHQAVYNVEPIINMDNSNPLLVELPPSQYCYAHNDNSTINRSISPSANIATSGDLNNSTHSHNATDGAIVAAMPTGYLPQLCMMENEIRQMIESLDAASGSAVQPQPPQQQEQYAKNPHVQLVDLGPVLLPFATVDIGMPPIQQQQQQQQPLETMAMVGSNPPEVVVAELDSLCEKLNQMKMLNAETQADNYQQNDHDHHHHDGSKTTTMMMINLELDSNEFIDNLVIPPPPTSESPAMIEEQQKVIEKFHKATTDVQNLCQERILEQQQQQQQRDQQLLHHYQEQWMRLVEEATNQQHEHDQQQRQLRNVKLQKLHRTPPQRPPLPDEVQHHAEARSLKRSAHLNTSVDQGLMLLAQRQQQLLQEQSSHPPPLSLFKAGPQEQDHERFLRESRHYSSLPALLNGSHTIDGQYVGEPVSTTTIIINNNDNDDNHHLEDDEMRHSSLVASVGGAAAAATTTSSQPALEQQLQPNADRLSKLFFDQNPFHNQQYNNDGTNFQTIMATRPMAMFNYIRQKQPMMTMQRSQSLNQINTNDDGDDVVHHVGIEMAGQQVEQEPPERPPLPSSMNLSRSGNGGGKSSSSSSSSHYLKPPIPPNHQPSSKEKRLRHQKLQQQQKQLQQQQQQLQLQQQSQKQAYNDRKPSSYLMSLPVLAPPSPLSTSKSSSSKKPPSIIVQPPPPPPPLSLLPTEQRTTLVTPVQTCSVSAGVTNQANSKATAVAAAAAAPTATEGGGGYRYPCMSPYEQAMSGSAPSSSASASPATSLWWNSATGGAGADSGRIPMMTTMMSSNGPLGTEYRQWLAKPGFVPHIYYGLAQRFNNMADTILLDPPLKHHGQHLLDFAYGTESKQACFQSPEMQDIFTQCQYDIDVLLARLEEVHERRLSTSGGHKMMLESLNSLNYHSNYNSNYNRLNGLVVKESLVVEARHFTTASKLFVKCATEASFQLIDFLTECVGLLERMFTISEDIIMMADIETQAQITCLVDRLKEVAVTYAYTVDVVRRLLENHHRPDRSINPYLDLLMNHAVSLATSLNTLIRTIRSMGLD